MADRSRRIPVPVPDRDFDTTEKLWWAYVTTLKEPIEQYAFRKTLCRVGRRYRTYRTYTEDEVRAAVGPACRVEHGSRGRSRSW